MDEEYNAFLEIIKEEEPLMDGRFHSIEPLSNKGCFSFVYKGYDDKEKQAIAFKFYNPSKTNDEYRLKSFHREAKLLEQLKGQKNIVELVNPLTFLEVVYKHSSSGREIKQKHDYYVLELAKSDIENYIYSDYKTDAVRNLLYFREMCKGVARIHKNNICHRDLKPNNFLICDGDKIKISDLGTATVMDGSERILDNYTSGAVGDLGYVAPETFCNIGVSDINTFTADIFSLGAILFEMFTKTRLTSKIYDELYPKLAYLNSRLEIARPAERENIYNAVIDNIISSHRLPDIFSYNDLVPKCIKLLLNTLYKDMCNLHYLKRLNQNNFESIYRRLNICLLILRNERIQKLRAKNN